VINSFDSGGAGAAVTIAAAVAPAVAAGLVSGAPPSMQALDVSALATSTAVIHLKRHRGIVVLPRRAQCRCDLTTEPIDFRHCTENRH
jgi:hypothetical protein